VAFTGSRVKPEAKAAFAKELNSVPHGLEELVKPLCPGDASTVHTRLLGVAQNLLDAPQDMSANGPRVVNKEKFLQIASKRLANPSMAPGAWGTLYEPSGRRIGHAVPGRPWFEKSTRPVQIFRRHSAGAFSKRCECGPWPWRFSCRFVTISPCSLRYATCVPLALVTSRKMPWLSTVPVLWNVAMSQSVFSGGTQRLPLFCHAYVWSQWRRRRARRVPP
jgi:hypothetical protein